MTSPAAPLSLPATLLKVARQKAYLRWIIVERGIYAATFWTLVAIVGSWLRHAHMGAAFTAILAVWLVLSLPVFYYQLSMIVDLLGYIFTGKVTFYPVLKAAAEAKTDDERRRLQMELMPPVLTSSAQSASRPEPSAAMRAFVGLLGNTSPLSCFSTWALVVLIRLPAETHQRVVVSAKKVITIQNQGELRVYNETIARFSHKPAS